MANSFVNWTPKSLRALGPLRAARSGASYGER